MHSRYQRSLVDAAIVGGHVIGGSGPQRLLPLVAKHAEHWNYPWNDPGTWTQRYERLGELCAASGRQLTDITTSVQIRSHGNDAAGFRRRADRWAETPADLCIVHLQPPYRP